MRRRCGERRRAVVGVPWGHRRPPLQQQVLAVLQLRLRVRLRLRLRLRLGTRKAIDSLACWRRIKEH